MLAAEIPRAAHELPRGICHSDASQYQPSSALNVLRTVEEDRIIISDGMDVSRLIHNIVDLGVQEDSFYVFDVQDVINKYRIWKEKIPRVEPFYAVKCNDHPFVLNILAALGTGFDCASKEEIRKVLALGVDPSRIIFAHPAKLPSHIKYAQEKQVRLTTFDSEAELYKIKNLYPEAKLVLRIRSDASIAQFTLGNKFGCDATLEAPALLHLAYTLNLEVVGICFHVGSGCGEPTAYRRAIKTAHQLFQLAQQIGLDMQLLDIGGGYSGYKNSSIDEVAEIINAALEDYFPISSGVKVISEPGSYFVASSFTIAVNVHSKRTLEDEEHPGSIFNMYYINDSIYTSFDVAFHIPAIVEPILLKKPNSTKTIRSTIWGASDDLDRIRVDIQLPDLNVGDWLMFENMGAYAISLSRTAACHHVPVPKICVLMKKSTRSLFENVIRGGIFRVDELLEFNTRNINNDNSTDDSWEHKLIARLSYMFKKACLWRLSRCI